MNNLEKEKELLESAQNDKNKFNELYKYFVNDVYRYSYSLLHNQHEAEDVTSRVFIQFYKKLNDFQWKNVSIKYWLFQAARNFCYEQYRIPKFDELDEEFRAKEEYEISFVDEIMNLEIVEEVKKEIANLKPVEREIINLRVWEGFGFKEIAQIQGMKEPAVKVRFYRSVEKLKVSLESKGIKKIIAIPFLFTIIKQVGSSPAYAAPIKLSTAADVGDLIKTLSHNSLPKATKLATSKAGIAVVSIISLVSAIGIGGYIYFRSNKSDTENKQNLSNITESTPTVEPTITLLPTFTSVKPPTAITSVPTQQNLSQIYSDPDLGFNFDYPSTFTINISRPFSGSLAENANFFKEIEVIKDINNKMVILIDNLGKGCVAPPSGPEIKAVDVLFYNQALKQNISRQLKQTADRQPIIIYSSYSSAVNGEGYDTGCGAWFSTNKEYGGLFTITVLSNDYTQDFSKFDEIVKSIR